MWHVQTADVARRTVAIKLYDDEVPLSFREVFNLCETSTGFGALLTATLAGSRFEAFFWELPPLTTVTLDASFECVLVEASSLAAIEADSAPFSEHFRRAGTDQRILIFPNLAGDAILVVPTPVVAEHRCYAQLAAFLRHGPEMQIASFWKSVGQAALARASSEPFWLSTAGTGVFWLHLRLDSCPKYYQHAPYKKTD